MKSWRAKILWSFLLGIMIATTASALEPQDSERFARASEEYKQMHYQDAYKLYHEISRPTPQVYFNMGNCAFKLNQYGRALWHWRQAEERWGIGGREDLYNNVRLVQDKLGMKAAKKDQENPLKKVGARAAGIIQAIPLLGLQLLFLFFWTLLFVFVRRLVKQKRPFLVAFLTSGMFVMGGLLLYRHIHAMHLRAIVIERQVTVYSGPSTTYQQVGVLTEGQEILIDKQLQDFLKIRTKGQFGWIARSAVGVI